MKILKVTTALFLAHLMLDGSVFSAEAACAAPPSVYRPRAVLRWTDKDQTISAVYSTFVDDVRSLTFIEPINFEGMISAVCVGNRERFEQYNRIDRSILDSRRVRFLEKLVQANLPALHKGQVLRAYDFITDSYIQYLSGFTQQVRSVWEQFERFESHGSSAYGAIQYGKFGGSTSLYQENEHFQLLVCSKLIKLQHDFKRWKDSFYVNLVVPGDNYTLAAFIFDCDAVVLDADRSVVLNEYHLALLKAIACGNEREVVRVQNILRASLLPRSVQPFALAPIKIIQRDGRDAYGEEIHLTPTEVAEVMTLPHQLPFNVEEARGYSRLMEEIEGFPHQEELARQRMLDEESVEGTLLTENFQKQARVIQEEALERKQAEEKRRLDELRIVSEISSFIAEDHQAFDIMNRGVEEIMCEHAARLKQQVAGARGAHGYTLAGEGIMEYGSYVYPAHNDRAQRIISDQLLKRNLVVQPTSAANVDSVLGDLEQWMKQLMARGIGAGMQAGITASFESFRTWGVKSAWEHQGFFNALLTVQTFDRYFQSLPEIYAERKRLNDEFSVVLVSAMSMAVEHKGRCATGAKGRTFLLNRDLIRFLSQAHQPQVAAS